MKKTLQFALIALCLLSTNHSYGKSSDISIHSGRAVDNISLGDSAVDTSKILGKFLFFEDTTEFKKIGSETVETRFYSYKNSVLGIKISLSDKKQKQYRKLHKSAKRNFIEANGEISEIKIIPLLGNISIRGSVTSKSSLNDVLTAFGPLNLKLAEDSETIKCYSSSIIPSPFNSNEHIMNIHYFTDGIKFEFLIAEKTLLSTITVSKVRKCLLVSELETF